METEEKIRGLGRYLDEEKRGFREICRRLYISIENTKMHPTSYIFY